MVFIVSQYSQSAGFTISMIDARVLQKKQSVQLLAWEDSSMPQPEEDRKPKMSGRLPNGKAL
jgi:hypothetical protein